MEKHAPQEKDKDPLKEDTQEADSLWVSDEPYEEMKIMGFIPLEPEPVEPEEGLELPEAADHIIAFLNNEHTVKQVEYILEMEERSGIQFNDYEEAWEWEQDPHHLTEEEQLRYIKELEERADCVFDDLDEAMEWARTNCEEYNIEENEAYESELREEDIGEDEERMRREFEYIMEMEERAGIQFDDYEEAKTWEQAEHSKKDLSSHVVRDSGLKNKEIEALRDMSEIREKKPEKAFNRSEQIELQDAPALTLKKGSQKQISIENEMNELEEEIKKVQAMEILDEAQVREIEVRILDLARRTGMDDLKKYGFNLER
ncbi:hypothetical protein JN11_03917 [Mucilaginibacter frigoritolerans]|uniref:Uncharacterized protein n=1 Tax=Mucilaginibacter frigoritolerans TaxID=652788 RepID=A0A562TUC3_9SPHI|nr:hypothetical protein [Mucilaginibacter frigoritolerans]TWI96804.1 hypothetical protein JN11_03917 [Mucilaginibacter frigoritolerans]